MVKVNHIGIIVDGNGRWAKERGLTRSEGHLAGSKNLEKLIKYIAQNKLANYLSLYVFSTENFNRSKEEVNYLMDLFLKWFKRYLKEGNDDNVKILFSSKKELLKPAITSAMEELEKRTQENTGLVVNICLSYGGRSEIINATKKISEQVLKGEITIDDIDEELFQKNLYQELPDIDFLIRTSGENRISNFMLWQSSYAEFYFPKTYFPAFDIDCLNQALEEYSKRDRRFGKIKEDKNDQS